MKAVNRISEENSRVKLNIYDLHDSNESLIPFGLGLFHSGVVVGGSEYTFASGGGIFNHEPKGAAAKFRETVNIGSFHGSSQQLAQIIEELRQDFTGSNYHVLTRNCNHFADEFLQRLVNKSIPGYINRLANLGSVFSCLLPESVTNNAPVDNNPSAGSLGSRTSNTRGKANIETSYRPFAGTPMVLGSAIKSNTDESESNCDKSTGENIKSRRLNSRLLQEADQLDRARKASDNSY